MKNGEWTARDGNNNSYRFEDSPNGMTSDYGTPMENVTVTARGKGQSLFDKSSYGQAINKSVREYPQWSAGLSQYYKRKSDGGPLSTGGDDIFYTDHLQSYARYYQAEQEWRVMSGVVVILFAFPVAAEAGIAASAEAFWWKVGLADVGQTIVNGGDLSQLYVGDMIIAGVSCPFASG